MKIEEKVMARSGGRCELCKGTADVQAYEVPPHNKKSEDDTIAACARCRSQLDKKEEPDQQHWMALTETMWSEVPGVQVVAWRMLNRLRNQSWAADALDLLYLDDDKLEWAKATGDHVAEAGGDMHKDAYGIVLQAGDNVVLTKSLDVKGSSVNAKVGTIVRNIRLVPDNTEQVEGKIDGQQIVILTKYVRRQG